MGVERTKTGWRARVYLDGKQIQVGVFETKREAKKAIATYRAPEKVSPVTVAELGKAWLKDHPRPSEVSNDTNRKRLNSFCRDFGNLKPSDVSPDLLRAWVKKNPSAARTAKLMLKEQGHPGVFSDTPIPTSKGRAKIIPFSEPDPDERIKLVSHAVSVAKEKVSLQFAAMIQFAAYSGLRPCEQIVLCWQDVNVTRGEVYVRRRRDRRKNILEGGKDDKPRTVALLPQALEAFSWCEAETEDFIWCGPDGPLTFDKHWEWWDLVREKADLPKGKAGQWYMLRHFFATYLLEAGARSWDVGKQMGHEDGTLVDRLYGHPSEDRARDRVRLLASQDQQTNVRSIR